MVKMRYRKRELKFLTDHYTQSDVFIKDNHKNMFKIPVGELLASYEGDTRSLMFHDDVPEDLWDDLILKDTLELDIQLTHIKGGIEVYFTRFETVADIDGIEYEIDIPPFERVFLEREDMNDPGSLDIINRKTGIIDLSHVIREETLMYAHY